MKGKTALYVGALSWLLATAALAQTPRLSNEASAQVRKEMRQYRKENIGPFLQTKRLELEDKLTPADRKELAIIRKQVALYQQQRKEQLLQLRTKREQKETVLTKEAKEAFQQQRAQHRAQMEKLARLAKRYEKPLAAIEAEFKGNWTKWHRDLNAISEKHAPNQATSENMLRVRLVQQALKNYFWNNNRFLLLVPGEPVPSHEDPWEETDSLAPTGPKSSLKLSPNPVLDKGHLTYSLAKAGKVRVELVNQQGQVVQQVVQEGQKAGQHQIPVNVAQLQTGLYYYRLSGPNHTETLRFLKQ
ncbi:T9SS type A sorting domain-containing protein [Rufibacter sp. LB8]|uniref:T9SS type A sorting domain-containing protein n=1 Tax=Rufibacter sp. LB8 TaxID=2777781 RepID=UPI00178C48B3|nr:T9SS type A sorting domain-containing protein [Rufibacter sp. LB8]